MRQAGAPGQWEEKRKRKTEGKKGMIEDGANGNNEKKSAGEAKKWVYDTELTERLKNNDHVAEGK